MIRNKNLVAKAPTINWQIVIKKQSKSLVWIHTNNIAQHLNQHLNENMLF